MIQYRKNNGLLGVIESYDSCHIEVHDDSFTIVRRIYGYDEYDWVDDKIENVIELRID